ncbi:TPA: transcriptional regulator [Providencia rettgeri]
MEKSNKIILDDIILYDKNTAKLTNILQDDVVATLTVPANECLSILINNSPEITTQKQLFSEVWEKHGIPINTNTFYQNISIIRKAFKQIGVDYDVITTIPRRGLVISNKIKITDYPDKEKIEQKCLINETYQKHKINTFKNKKYILWLSVLVFTLLFFLYFNYTKILSPLYDYHFISQYNGCAVYANDSYSQSFFSNVIKKINLEKCDNSEIVYISIIPDLPRISTIICDKKPYESDSSCRSAYYYLTREMK